MTILFLVVHDDSGGGGHVLAPPDQVHRGSHYGIGIN